MASDHRTEPRFIVVTSIFFLYGVFLIIVLLFSGTQFWKDICTLLSNYARQRLGLRVNDSNGEDVVRSGNVTFEGIPYELLSEGAKKRLDTLRLLAIKRLLSHFSMTLKNEDMVKRLSANSNHEIDSTGTASTDNNDSTVSTMVNEEHSLPDTHSSCLNLEEGLCSSKESSCEEQCVDFEDSTYERECGSGDNFDIDESSFTHVLIPHPGVGVFEGEHSNTCKEAAASKELGKDKNNKTDIEITSDNDKIVKRMNKQGRRKVPIFCSICLSEFELGENICWSSNTECTHVFHSDCISQWLVALGRRCSAGKRFTLNPTEKQLLGSNEVQCPCCRQEFIKSGLFEKRICTDINAV